jgi:hypothetical protein
VAGKSEQSRSKHGLKRWPVAEMERKVLSTISGNILGMVRDVSARETACGLVRKQKMIPHSKEDRCTTV